MKHLLTLLVISLLATASFAQATLSEAWFGDWSGELNLFGPTGPTQTLGMELHIKQAQDSTHHYDWTIVYIPADTSKPVDRRAYELIGLTDAPNHFVIDEKNSIFLDCYLYDQVMTSFFRVNSSMIIINYAYLGGDSMRVEIFPATTEHTRVSGEELEDLMVEAYPQTGYHRAILYRTEAKSVDEGE